MVVNQPSQSVVFCHDYPLHVWTCHWYQDILSYKAGFIVASLYESTYTCIYSHIKQWMLLLTILLTIHPIHRHRDRLLFESDWAFFVPIYRTIGFIVSVVFKCWPLSLPGSGWRGKYRVQGKRKLNCLNCPFLIKCYLSITHRPILSLLVKTEATQNKFPEGEHLQNLWKVPPVQKHNWDMFRPLSLQRQWQNDSQFHRCH